MESDCSPTAVSSGYMAIEPSVLDNAVGLGIAYGAGIGMVLGLAIRDDPAQSGRHAGLRTAWPPCLDEGSVSRVRATRTVGFPVCGCRVEQGKSGASAGIGCDGAHGGTHDVTDERPNQPPVPHHLLV